MIEKKMKWGTVLVHDKKTRTSEMNLWTTKTTQDKYPGVDAAGYKGATFLPEVAATWEEAKQGAVSGDPRT